MCVYVYSCTSACCVVECCCGVSVSPLASHPDIVTNPNLEKELRPLLNAHKEIETVVECSAKQMKMVREVFYLAQKVHSLHTRARHTHNTHTTTHGTSSLNSTRHTTRTR